MKFNPLRKEETPEDLPEVVSEPESQEVSAQTEVPCEGPEVIVTDSMEESLPPESKVVESEETDLKEKMEEKKERKEKKKKRKKEIWTREMVEKEWRRYSIDISPKVR